ncbi:MAG: N-6 DNA methylase [Candidatus Gastranaerophilaceae bacterium]|nr:N-6 DNA methylase [Candidatus Gastranaerophilaceae bacterium]
MELGFGNARKGQFFTPYSVSKLMAEINVGNIENIADRELITLSEPCSGSGGIIIAFAESLKEKDYNYQNKLFVEAIDIDEMCFMMTYIQLSLYGIAARVMLGDTLAYKFSQMIYTPMYFINPFIYKCYSIYQI